MLHEVVGDERGAGELGGADVQPDGGAGRLERRHFLRQQPGNHPGEDVARARRGKPGRRARGDCGGCQLQHVDDEASRAFLVDRVAGALAAQGIAAPEILEPHLSPPNTRRRAAMRAERRGGQPARRSLGEGGVLLGFNAEASHRIVDLRECHILRPELFALVAPLRALLGRLLPPRGRAEIRLTWCDQGADILVEGASPEGLEAAEAVTAFAQAHQLARFAVDDGDGAQTLWEPEPATITLGGVPVALPHGAFLQATGEGEAALVASVREAILPGLVSGMSGGAVPRTAQPPPGDVATRSWTAAAGGGGGAIADLFAGLGTFALSLDGRILAVEAARDAALALKAAAARAERTIFVDHRDLYRRPLDVAELDRFEAIVLDPPRAGAREQAVQLAASAVPRLAYVSCNPNTFARDAKILVDGGYRLAWVRPVGQFRWSTHVELAACFTR